MLCEYGCGQEAKYQFKNGKWCCSTNFKKCPNCKKKFSGKNHPFFGKKHSLDAIKKIKKSTKGYTPWNKGKTGVYSEETLLLMSISRQGKSPWNKGKTGVYSEESLQKMSNSSKGFLVTKQTRKKMKNAHKNRVISFSTRVKLRLSIKKIKAKFPMFSKIEKIRYNPDKPNEREIQVHCKNHNCPNSKEQGGWFTPQKQQIYERIACIENPNGYGESNFYCCNECKQECPLYGKTVTQLIKEDQIKAGIINEDLYTTEEYKVWRQEVLKRSDYKCEYCENDAKQCHHSRPQKLEPGFTLDPDFGVACCSTCHYKYGHKTGTECSTGNLANKVCI